MRVTLKIVCLVCFGITLRATADGLPGEYLLTQRWRDLYSGRSAASNPAFITEDNFVNVRTTFSPVQLTDDPSGDFRLWEVGATIPIGLYQTAGLSWLAQDGGDIPGYDFAVDGALERNSSSIPSQEHFFLFSYAINPWRRLSLGANLNIAYQNLFGDAYAGLGLDLGASYRLLNHPLFGNHLLGLMLQNAITPQTSEGGENLFGDFFKNFAFWRGGGENRYAANLRTSWIGSFLEDQLEGGIDMDIKDIFSQTDEFARTISADAEGSGVTRLEEGTKKIEFDMNFRVGGWPLRRIAAGWFQWGTDYWGLSAGINIPMVNSGRDLMIMYQYINLFEEEFTRNHTWYFRGEFGNHREEIYARRMARLADVFPNSLYEKGMRLYYQGKYWDAYFVFGRLVAQYPDFFKNDWVSYYRGASLEAMDMQEQAIRAYQGTIGDYPRSKAVKHAELGIMRVAYLQNDDNIVERQYETLDTDETPDSLRNHAHYLIGESFMNNENYHAARTAFERIPPEHPDYIFAQHSLAVAFVHVPSLEQAALALQRCLQVPTETEAQKEISNRSALLLGLLYYEQQALSQAVSALRLVPQGTYHYEEALLGMGWTALKARQWNDCISAGRELAARAEYEELRADGLLLQGYAYLVQKDHLNAARVFDQAVDIAEKLDAPSVDSLVARRRQYSRDREQYRLLAGRAKELSLMNPNSQIAKTTDSLHKMQEQLESRMDEHKDFIDNIQREMFFSRNIATIRADIQYAQAVIQKIVNRSQEMRATDDAREEQKDIDEKIRDLKRDLEKLEKEEQD